MSNDNLDKTSELSSICDELRSTSQQREQELQSISQLLEGIRQLQAAQQEDTVVVDEDAERAQDGAAADASGTAAEQLQQLQQALLQQSQLEHGAQPIDWASLAKTPGIPAESTSLAGTAALANADGQTWPQTALLQLLDEANNSGSTKANALCGASSGSSSSSSNSLTPQTAKVGQEFTLGHQQQDGQALSMFSFAAGATPAALKYITPLKIPHPVRPRSTRCSNIDSNSGDSSSVVSSDSRQGSYAGTFYKGEGKPPGHTGPAPADGAYKSPVAAARSQCTNLHKALSSAAHPPATDAAQRANAWQPPASADPKLAANSSMSSEAAALMMALRAAAQQREAAREVLQARSSVATTALTCSTATPRGAAATDLGRANNMDGNKNTAKQQKLLQDVANLVAPPAAAAQAAAIACNRPLGRSMKDAGQEQQPAPQHRQLQGVDRARSPLSTSPTQQPSVVGPRVHRNSSHSSVYRSQRAAADRLMQEAVESSSMSSLMALLDSEAVSEDEDEVPCTAACAAAAATAHVVVGRAGVNVTAACTWGTSSVSAPSGVGNSGRNSPQTFEAAAGRSANDSWPSQQLQGGQFHQQQLAQQQQQQHSGSQQLQERHRYPLDSRANSTLSAGTSELQYDVLSAELELLSSQVEQERQQLQQLQHQRQAIEQKLPQAAAANAARDAPQQPQQQQREQLECETAALTRWHHQQRILRRSRSCGALTTAAALAGGKGSQSVLLGAAANQQAASCHSRPAAAHRQTHAEVQTEPAPSTAATLPVIDVSTQAGCGAVDTTAGPAVADVGCQALLLHVSGLEAVGPPAPCRVCPDVQQQLRELQQKLEKAHEQQKQSQLSAEQSRHQAMVAEAQLALSRQKLRAVLSATAKPLAMSGWEDLIEEAAADLEKIEGHVSTAAERLIELQAASTSAAEGLISAQRESERQASAAATAALKNTELQQQAEGLVAAISSNEYSKEKGSQQLQALQQRLEQQQATATAAEQQLQELQLQLQQKQQQVADANQQLAEKGSMQQQLMAELSEKQHQLQITRGDCASAQDRLSQLQTSLIEARQQLEDLQQQQRQQQRQHEETGKQLAALQAQRTAAGAEAASAQQELDRVLRELDQCQKDTQAAELQQAELDEATAEQQRLHEQHSKAAAAAAKQLQKLEADSAAAQDELKQLQQQAQAAKHEADLCTRAAAAADHHLAQVQQTLTALQAGTAHAAGHRSATVADASSAAATAHLAECAQLQVKLAAAESRRQLAEERAEQSDRRLQQLKSEVSSLHSQHESAERQLRQVTTKCEKMKEKLREKCESLTDAHNQLQQAQMQLQSMKQAAAAAGSAAWQDARAQKQQAADSQAAAAVAAQAEAQRLIQSYQQRLSDLETEASSARAQLQQAEQQLDQQRQANSSLQQQLSTVQQQLVHAQQQLLEVPKQYSAGALSQQQQADQMHMAVRSSIQGLHEAFGLQTKLQQAQMQAGSAKQQLQELQQEKKQLQKKLAAYKQQLTELKSVYDSQQVLLQQQRQQQASSADSSHVAAFSCSAGAGQLEELKQQQVALSAELAGVQQRLADSQQQLQWAKREAEHLRQLLQQQQEISDQLRSEVQRLQRYKPPGGDQPQLIVQSQASQTVSGLDRQCPDSAAAAAADAANQLQQMKTDLAAARQQLEQAKDERTAAQRELAIMQQRLQSTEHLQLQQTQQLADAKKQLHEKESEVSAKAQQLVQQQQERKWQQVQWEQKLQADVQQAGQELLECHAELAGSQAALQQLQAAAAALEQQLSAAVQAAQQKAADSSITCDTAGRLEHPATSASTGAGSQSAVCLAHAVQLGKQLAEMCSAALDAKLYLVQQLEQQQKLAEQQLQQHSESHSRQLQQMMKALEVAELHRQEAELLQLQQQQECQLLRLQQQHQDKQLQLPGHMQSVASVIDMMEQLHAATQQSILSSAAAWGTSSCGVLRGSAVPRLNCTATAPAAVAAAGTCNTAAGTPQMSIEALGSLLPPTTCLSPEIPAVGTTVLSDNVKPTAARGLQYGPTPSVTSAAAATAAALGSGAQSCQQHKPFDNQVAHLRERLVQLSQDMIAQLQNPGASVQQQQMGHGVAASPQQQPAVGGSGAAAAGSKGLADVVLADAELQESWQRLQEQAAGHDNLMQHMRHMWLQVTTLAQHCSALQQAAADQKQAQMHHCGQEGQQQQQQQRQAPLSRSQSPEVQAEYQSGGNRSQQSLHLYEAGPLAQPTAGPDTAHTFLAAVQPLLVVAQQLQQDVAELTGDNKHLLEAAKKLCSSFRSGGRTVRVRALALKLDLQQHGLPWDHNAGHGAAAPATAAATAGHSALPADVAVSVVQHWNEVETLLAQLHQECEALLQPKSSAAGQQQQQQHQQHSGSAAGSSSSSSVRRHAARRCKRLVEDLQHTVDLCQQQESQQQQLVPYQRRSSPAVVTQATRDVLQQQACSHCSADCRSRSRSPEVPLQQAAVEPAQHQPKQSIRTHQTHHLQQQQSVGLLPSSSPSCCSSCSSEGLSSLLALVKGRLAAQSTAGGGQTSPIEGGSNAVLKHGSSRPGDKHLANTGNREPAPAQKQPRQQEARLTAAALQDLDQGKPTSSRNRGNLRHDELAQHSGRLAGRALGPVQSDDGEQATGQQRPWNQIHVATSANLRRAERAVLMERLKLLQQQPH